MVRQYSTTLRIQTPLFGIDAQEFAHVTLHDWLQLQQRQVQISDSKQDKIAAETARLEYRKLRERPRLPLLNSALRHNANLHPKWIEHAIEGLHGWIRLVMFQLAKGAQ